MTERFIQLKKSAEKRCFLFTALFGGSAALFLLGGLLLLFKLLAVHFPWYGYALCAFGALASVGGGVFFATYPFVKRFARQLDERYRLDERVRTMLEYDGQEGAVLSLQREDTEERLAALPKRRYGWKQITALCIAPVLAVGVLVGSFLVPKDRASSVPSVEPPKEEELVKPSEFAVDDLKKIIENVKSSELSTALITVNVTVLEGLLAKIEGGEVLEKATVSEGMLTIQAATTAENTYNAFLAASKAWAIFKPLDKALKESAKAYDEIPEANVYDYTTLQDKRGVLSEKVTARLNAYAEVVKGEIASLSDESGYIAFVGGYIAAIDGVLAAESISALATEESLKKALVAWRTGLASTLNASYTALADGTYLAGAKSTAKEQCTLLVRNGGQTEGLAVAMHDQAYVYMMNDYVLKGLSKIFGVPVPVVESESEGEGEDPPAEGGGGGGGEFSYPSEGLVLDPTDGQYKPYGEVLASYYARVLELLEGDETEAAAELKAYIDAYFKALH